MSLKILISIISVSFVGLLPNLSIAQSIKVKVRGVSDTTVYLANYYGEKLFYNDTTLADANGFVEFKGKSFEEGGKYAIVVPGPKYFEFIVTEEDIELETDVNDFVGSMKVIRSEENRLFFDYMKYIVDKRNERGPWDRILSDSLAKPKQIEQAQREIEALNADVVNYQAKLLENNPDKLFTKMLKLTLEPEVPEAPDGVEDERVWRYWQYRKHYWDNVDLTDGRLVRDPMFHKVVDKYWTKVLPQVPDTLLLEGKKLIDDAEAYDIFKYFAHHFTFSAEKSNIMCMDKVFVGLINTYYRTGRVDLLNEEQLSKIIERADDLKYVICGEPVPNIILPDTSLTNWVSLYDVKSKYTVVAIWESNCGHCKKEMPKLQKLYEEWHPRGVEIFAIGNDFETEPWLKFIRERDIKDWIHVSDNPAINQSDSATKLIYGQVTTLPSLNFRSTFDVFSTPKVFLLDEEKRIIAKQLSAEQIGELLERLEGADSRSDTTHPAGDRPKGGRQKASNETLSTANADRRLKNG